MRPQPRLTSGIVSACMIVLTAGAHVASGGQQGRTTRVGDPPRITAGGQTDWASHNLDLHNRRFAELDQINVENAGRLAERWSFDVPAGVGVAQVTPIVVDGVMYFHGGASIFAVNAVTGESIWTLELESSQAGGRVRGPTYGDGKIYAYSGANLIAADATTGELVESFGDGGVLPVVGLALQAKYPTSIRRRSTRSASATA